VRDDHTAGDCNRIAAGMAEDETLVQNQIGFPGRSYHQNLCLRRERAGAAS